MSKREPGDGTEIRVLICERNRCCITAARHHTQTPSGCLSLERRRPHTCTPRRKQYQGLLMLYESVQAASNAVRAKFQHPLQLIPSFGVSRSDSTNSSCFLIFHSFFPFFCALYRHSPLTFFTSKFGFWMLFTMQPSMKMEKGRLKRKWVNWLRHKQWCCWKKNCWEEGFSSQRSEGSLSIDTGSDSWHLRSLQRAMLCFSCRIVVFAHGYVGYSARMSFRQFFF